MRKQKLIDKSLTVFCWNVHGGKYLSVYGCESHHEEGYRSKIRFIKMIEHQGWRYVENNWYCLVCAKMIVTVDKESGNE